MGSVVRIWIFSCYAITAKTNLGSPEEKDHRNGRQQAHEQGVFTPCTCAGSTTSSHSHNQEEDALCIQVLYLSCLDWREGHTTVQKSPGPGLVEEASAGHGQVRGCLNGSR